MKQLLESIWNMPAWIMFLIIALIAAIGLWWFVRVSNHKPDVTERSNRRIDFDEHRRRVKAELAKAREKML